MEKTIKILPAKVNPDLSIDAYCCGIVRPVPYNTHESINIRLTPSNIDNPKNEDVFMLVNVDNCWMIVNDKSEYYLVHQVSCRTGPRISIDGETHAYIVQGMQTEFRQSVVILSQEAIKRYLSDDDIDDGVVDFVGVDCDDAEEDIPF